MKNTHYNLIDTLRLANPDLWSLALETFHAAPKENYFMEQFPIAYFRKFTKMHMFDSVAYTYYDCVLFAIANNYGV